MRPQPQGREGLGRRTDQCFVGCARFLGGGEPRYPPTSARSIWPFFASVGHAKDSPEVAPLLTTHLRIKLRQAIGWIAVYALALQTILGSVAPHSTISFDTLPFDPAAIICLSSHGGNAGDVPGRDRDTARATVGQGLAVSFRGTCPFSLVHSPRLRTPPFSSRTVASRESGWRP
jgi:hypothetical protein